MTGQSPAVITTGLMKRAWSKPEGPDPNLAQAKYFAAAFSAIAGLFIIFRLTRKLYINHRRNNGHESSENSLVKGVRSVYEVSTSKLIFGYNGGLVLLYLAYWAINVVLYLTNVSLNNLHAVGSRLGWMAVLNLVIVIFLSLKHTPLALLSVSSYEKLLPLHKVAGYTTIIAAWAHGILNFKYFSDLGLLNAVVEEDGLLAGVLGIIGFAVIGISTFPWLMKGGYEVFYVLHFLLTLFVIIVIGLHKSIIAEKVLIVILLIASMTFVDRALRFGKLVYYSFGNYATLTALPGGATRVRLHCSINAKQASHAYLWIPSIRLIQTHPFTLVSTNPVEFVVREHDGFTRDLHRKAQQVGPEAKLRVSLNGPYGAPTEDFTAYDDVVLVAGGSGGSFTFPVALDLVRRRQQAKEDKQARIRIVWAVRTKDALNWYRYELEELISSGIVEVKLYMSMLQGTSSSNNSVPSSSASSRPNLQDAEKRNHGNSFLGVKIEEGRPDLDSLLNDFIDEAGPSRRVIVGACGPRSFMNIVHAHASRNAGNGEGAVVTYYNEVYLFIIW
ncbi:ferric reductase NAD binding domain-containing protein [Talaromyces proteolyticus]|uniref:Ferric reductase NAD binding domain-containing protein n=1 Tax=Talaromyces proteolyticus TaxID=1131652 RepID=A0AAD4KU10_9EURO|nr:ferric reductase NAD binding domain-containing protein [Talaromyces proteolyticus]KAH8700857.1 ferric reductase NAD binding domain-containing protein [Talaromyces proteolyticus]